MDDLTTHLRWMRRAFAEAEKALELGEAPVGAVIVKNNQVLATGVNQVTGKNDPTAHAEVEAIRAATAKVANFQLEGCTLYSSCEPCPMCLGASYWAGIDRIFFASTKEDAEKAGFSDAFIYREIELPIEKRNLSTKHLNVDSAGDEFAAWDLLDEKLLY